MAEKSHDRNIFDPEYCESRCPICTRARRGNRIAKRNVSTFLRHLRVEISEVLVRFASSISLMRGPAPRPPGFFKAWQGCAVAGAVVC